MLSSHFVMTSTIAISQKLGRVLMILDKTDLIFHLVLLCQSVFPSSLFKLRLWCIQSDRFDTVYVYGSWFCPWSASVDRCYHQCCWQQRETHLFIDRSSHRKRHLILETPCGQMWRKVMWLVKARWCIVKKAGYLQSHDSYPIGTCSLNSTCPFTVLH